MRPILGTFLAIVGLAWIGAGVFDWAWVIGAVNNRLLVSVLGRTGTRLFFAFGGMALVVFGILYAADLM